MQSTEVKFRSKIEIGIQILYGLSFAGQEVLKRTILQLLPVNFERKVPNGSGQTWQSSKRHSLTSFEVWIAF